MLSRLDSANSLLVDLPACYLQKLQVGYNDAARLMARVPRSSHVTPLLRRPHRLPVQQRVEYKLQTVTYKALNCDLAPVYLTVQHCQAPYGLQSVSQHNLRVPWTNKGAGDRAFYVAGPRLWNNFVHSLLDSVVP